MKRKIVVRWNAVRTNPLRARARRKTNGRDAERIIARAVRDLRGRMQRDWAVWDVELDRVTDQAVRELSHTNDDTYEEYTTLRGAIAAAYQGGLRQQNPLRRYPRTNPLRAGYSRESIATNIATELHAGRKQAQAVAIAYSVARKAWKRAHPGRAAPANIRRRNDGEPMYVIHKDIAVYDAVHRGPYAFEDLSGVAEYLGFHGKLTLTPTGNVKFKGRDDDGPTSFVFAVRQRP